jgi:hypothetical protein
VNIRQLNINEFIKNHTNAISTVIVIGAASLFFIYCGATDNKRIIAHYSLLTIYIFLLLHLFSLGLDQFIISNQSNLEQGKLSIGLVFFYPLLFLLIFGFLLGVFNNSNLVDSYDNLGLEFLSEKNQSIPLSLIIACAIFGVYSKLFAGVLTKVGMTERANLYYFGKAVGFICGAGIAILIDIREWLILIPLATELVPFLILLPTIRKIKLKKTYEINFSYVLSGLNVFSFDAIMKGDLLILSRSEHLDYLPVYSIISAVFEGFIQIFASYRYAFVEIVKNGNIFERLKKLARPFWILSLLFIPGALIFNYITVNQFDIYVFTSILLLQLALISGIIGIVSFHYLEIIGKPLQLTFISLVCVFINLIFGIFLVDKFTIVGVSIASLIAYLVLTLINIYILKKNTRKYNSEGY